MFIPSVALIMRRLAPLALLSVGACSGKCSEPASDELGAALITACRSACSAFVTAGCDRAGLRLDDQARCVEACDKENRAFAAARCETHRLSYLECVGRATPQCAVLDCSAAHCIEQGRGSGCDAAFGQYRKCVSPCLFAGTLHTAERSIRVGEKQHRTDHEIVRLGCAECPATRSLRAPPGSPCQAASVCSQECCRCKGGPSAYLARLCIDGVCADPGRACEVTAGVAEACK